MPRLHMLAAGVALLGLSGLAQAEVYNWNLQFGPQPGVANFGTATGTTSYDSTSNLLSWNVTYDLHSDYTVAHWHSMPLGGGVTVNTPRTSGSADTGAIVGNATLTDPQEQQMLSTGWYMNIHSSTSPGGEIFAVIPEPATLSMLGAGAFGLLVRRRRA